MNACCHDNFEWHDTTTICPACGLDQTTWQRIATARTDTLINYLNGDTMTLPIQLIDSPNTRPIAPTRVHAHDAGIDLYAAETRWIFDDSVTAVRLGVRVAIPEGHVGLLTLRSSLGAEGLIVPNAPGIIDAGFRGELRILLTCVGGTDEYRVESGDRIAQLTILPIATPAVEVVAELPPSGDGRGVGGFGSTGRA